MARIDDIDFSYKYKMVNIISHITLPPSYIIKYTNLLYLKIDDFLAINRLELLLIYS